MQSFGSSESHDLRPSEIADLGRSLPSMLPCHFQKKVDAEPVGPDRVQLILPICEVFHKELLLGFEQVDQRLLRSGTEGPQEISRRMQAVR
jgi:hypothetical protein